MCIDDITRLRQRQRGEMCEQENESKEGKRREKRRKRVKGRKRVITSRVWERNLE